MRVLLGLSILLAVGFIGFSLLFPHQTVASANMRFLSDQSMAGTIQFYKKGDATWVEVLMLDVAPGLHGLHIHENGDCSGKDGSNAGGHYNLDKHPHAGLTTEKRHMGDLGNVMADKDGAVNQIIRVDDIEFRDIDKRSIILHGAADDLVSQPAGDSGARIACGVIDVKQQ